MIEDQVEAQVSSIVSNIGFTAYNSFIAEQVKHIAEDVCHEDITAKILKIFNDIYVMKRESIKLSEIFGAYREYINDEIEESEQYDLEGHWYASMEENEDYHWLDIKLGKEKSRDRFRSHEEHAIEFTVHRKGGKDSKEGWIGSIYIEGRSMEDVTKLGSFSKMETLLFNIAYNKTPIEIDVEDEDDIDNSFNIDY
jgi:hypothetical protein